MCAFYVINHNLFLLLKDPGIGSNQTLIKEAKANSPEYEVYEDAVFKAVLVRNANDSGPLVGKVRQFYNGWFPLNYFLNKNIRIKMNVVLYLYKSVGRKNTVSLIPGFGMLPFHGIAMSSHRMKPSWLKYLNTLTSFYNLHYVLIK